MKIALILGGLAELLAVVSTIGHFYQYFKHKSEEKIMLGFLHALKPLVESAAAYRPIPTHTWAGEVKQIEDMLARLQPPRKIKSACRRLDETTDKRPE
jgi:hypothetical protein